MSRILFFVSFLLLLLFSYWVGDGVLYPLGVGVFLALLYLVLVGLVFFFHVVPSVKRRVLDGCFGGSLRLLPHVSASCADGYTGRPLRVVVPSASRVEAWRF